MILDLGFEIWDFYEQVAKVLADEDRAGVVLDR